MPVKFSHYTVYHSSLLIANKQVLNFLTNTLNNIISQYNQYCIGMYRYHTMTVSVVICQCIVAALMHCMAILDLIHSWQCHLPGTVRSIKNRLKEVARCGDCVGCKKSDDCGSCSNCQSSGLGWEKYCSVKKRCKHHN